MEYVVDGGGSRAVHDAVAPVLEEIRALLGAELGVLAYEPRGGPGSTVALATTASAGPVGFLPNEPIVTDRAFPPRAPATLDRLEIRSRLRGHGVRLRSCVVVPWHDRHGHGAVVLGNRARPLGDPDAVLDDDVRRHYRRAIGRAVRRGRQDGALQVDRDLRSATRTMAAAAVSGGDTPEVLTTILSSARELFRAEVAYLGVPADASGTYVFDEAIGIHTAPFRCLRVRHGQGLGGLARRLGRPVCSANYAADARLESALVDETRGEGIVSAMAAPVSVGDEIVAVLYIGDRHMRPFTAVDEDLLEELAGHAAPAIHRRYAEADRARALERTVRERVAYDLHDSVVRGLVAIGFEAEQARHAVTDGEPAGHLDSIARAAEACLSRLRGEIGFLVTAGTVPASEILARILAVPGRDAARSPGLDGDDLDVPTPVADALVRVGQEAVTNAERHSGCRHVRVLLETSPRRVVLHVTDDGSFGGVGRGGGSAGTDGAPHFGLDAMRSAVAGVGGALTLERATPEGTHVRATVEPRADRPGATP